MSSVYTIEPCMIGDSATAEDAAFVADYLTRHGCPAKASAAEGCRNDPDLAPSDALWNEAVEACAVANDWDRRDEA